MEGAFADHRAVEPSRSRWDSAPASSVRRSEKQTGFLLVRLALGVILLTAAGLKLADDGSGVTGVFAHPLWRLTLVEAEAFLGGWLLLGLAPRILWLITLLFFTVLAGASLHMGSIGQPSCGCFGNKVHVQPWCMFALDLFLVAGLVWCHPPPGVRVEVHSATLKAILAVVTGSGVILAVAFGGLAWLS